MTNDVHKLIETLLKAQAYEGKRPIETHPVVTISRDHGSGGGEIADLLAKRLNIPVYDKELMDAVVDQSGANPHLMAQLDEKTHGFWDSWIVSILSGENVQDDYYRRYLVKVVLGIFNTGNGGVIVGRGAHLILARQHVFRVRIVASPQTCAERVASKKSISVEQACKLVTQTHKNRSEFVWNLFKQRLNEPANYDLTINTDQLNKYEEVTEIILHAMQRHHPVIT